MRFRYTTHARDRAMRWVTADRYETPEGGGMTRFYQDGHLVLATITHDIWEDA